QPDGVVYAGKVAYTYKGEMPQNLSISLKNGTIGIAGLAFYGCTSLKSITIPDSVTIIDREAFYSCTSLASITIPDSVTEIGVSAFDGCTSLESVIIPDSVTSIGDYAFYGCTSLTIYGYSGSYAEKYANQKGFKFVDLDSIITYTDSSSGISVSTTTQAELLVEKITDNESISKANAVLSADEKLTDLYDISLMQDGVVIQPDGTATVKIPCDNENAKVYRIEDDGTATDMNAVYKNGYMVFSTDHFSLYALVLSNEGILGDLDGDSEVTTRDVLAYQKHLAKITLLTDEQKQYADLNGDGDYNSQDILLIQKIIAKIAI
ncbi:MAG: leucine-rich repeat protein, partial [Acutalibacteraceae bacterium]